MNLEPTYFRTYDSTSRCRCSTLFPAHSWSTPKKGLNGSHKIVLRCLGIESLLNGSYQIETIRVNGRVYSEIVYFEKALDQEGNL